jgi:hypothetical protein
MPLFCTMKNVNSPDTYANQLSNPVIKRSIGSIQIDRLIALVNREETESWAAHTQRQKTPTALNSVRCKNGQLVNHVTNPKPISFSFRFLVESRRTRNTTVKIKLVSFCPFLYRTRYSNQPSILADCNFSVGPGCACKLLLQLNGHRNASLSAYYEAA